MKIRSAGFTLVEIMVVLGVMAILFAAMMSMMNYSSRATQSTTASNDFNGLVNTLDSVLANSVTCGALLGPGGLGLSLQATPPQALPPLTLHGVTLVTNPTTNQGMYGSTLQIMQLELAAPSGAAWVPTGTSNQYQVSLVVQACKGAGYQTVPFGSPVTCVPLNAGSTVALGGSLLTKTFSLIINTASGAGSAITGCSAQANYWTAEASPNQNNIYNTNSGNVGIGTSTPALLLDVAGAVRPQGPPSGTTCSAATEGAMAYNHASHAMQYCAYNAGSNTYSWTAFGSDIVGQSIGSPGYVLFSNGLQIAWGQGTTPGNGIHTSPNMWGVVSLPVSFTTIWSITATVIPNQTTWSHLEPGGNVPYSILVSAPTANSFQAACIGLSAGGGGTASATFFGAVQFSYLVIGQGSTTP